MFLTVFVLSSKGSLRWQKLNFVFNKLTKKRSKLVNLKYKQRFFLSVFKFFVKYVKKREVIKVKNKNFFKFQKVKLLKIIKGSRRYKWLKLKYMRSFKKYKKEMFLEPEFLRLNKFRKLSKKMFKIKRRFFLNSVGRTVDLVKLRFFIFKLRFLNRVKLNFLHKKRFYKLLRLKFSFVKKVVKYWRAVIGYAFRRFMKFFISPAVGLMKVITSFMLKSNFVSNNYYRNLYYGVFNGFGYLVNNNRIKRVKLLNSFTNIASGGFYGLKYGFGKLLKTSVGYFNKFVKRRVFLSRFMGYWLGKKYKLWKFYWRKFNNLVFGISAYIKVFIAGLSYIRFWEVYVKFLRLVLRKRVSIKRRRRIWKKLKLKSKFLLVGTRKKYNFFCFGFNKLVILKNEKYKKLKEGIFYVINLGKGKRNIKKVRRVFLKKFIKKENKKYVSKFVINNSLKKKKRKKNSVSFLRNKKKKRNRFYSKSVKGSLFKRIIFNKNSHAYIVRTTHNIPITAVRRVNKVAFVFSSGRSIKYAKRGFRKIVRSKRASYYSAKLLSKQAKTHAIKIRYRFGQIHIRNKRSGLLRSAAKHFVYGVWFNESLVQFILPHNGLKKKKKKRV